jgi:hypothetical protein
MPRFGYDEIAQFLNDDPREPIPAYVWHSGGGVMTVRVDIAPEGGKPKEDDPFMLLTPREDFDGKPGIAVGYYPTWEHTGEWPEDDPAKGTLRFADRLEDLHVIIVKGSDLLCGRP